VRERVKNMVEVDVKHLMAVLDKYFKTNAMELGKVGEYITGWNQRKLARYVQRIRNNEDISSEE
jgi:hypothetical protein